MFPQARVFIRTALVYLGCALVIGGVLLVDQGLYLSAITSALHLAFYHLLMVGWMVQFICGVALWLFPVKSRTKPRGNERLGWAAYAALNSGLLLRILAEPLHLWQHQTWTAGALVASALLQVGGVWMLIAVLWPRVTARPTKKEQAHTV